jgi:HEAT repeat protein
VKKFVTLCAVLLPGCGGTSTAEHLDQLRAADSAARLRAVKALGDRKSEAARVVPALAEALQDRDAFVRRDAARALGKFGPSARPALPALQLLLKDRNASVRKAAAQACKAIDPEMPVRREGN